MSNCIMNMLPLPAEYRKGVENVSEQERAILNTLKEPPHIRSKEVQDVLQAKEVRARKILKGMEDKGILERRGTGRNTYYISTL